MSPSTPRAALTAALCLALTALPLTSSAQTSAASGEAARASDATPSATPASNAGPASDAALPTGWRHIAGPATGTREPTQARLPVTVMSDDQVEVLVTDASRVFGGGDDVIDIMEALGLAALVHAAPERSATAAGRAARHHFLFNRTTSAEGILSLEGTLFLGNSLRRHGRLAQTLRATGLPAVIVDDLQPAPQKIRKLAAGFGLVAEGETLAGSVQQQLDEAAAMGSAISRKPRVLHVSASGGGGRPTVGGRDTAAAQLIRLAGGINVGDNAQAADYTSLSNEGMIAADPEIVVLTEADLELFGGEAGFWGSYPTLKQTVAGKANRIWVLPDDQLKVAGANAGAGAIALAQAFRDYADR